MLILSESLLYFLLSFFFFVFLSEELSEDRAHQMYRKELPLEYPSLHLYAYFLFDSSAFYAPFFVLSSNRFFWREFEIPNIFTRLIHSVKKPFHPLRKIYFHFFVPYV